MTSTQLRHQSASSLAASGVGAVVLGGDYQGLGIVRSLGRCGVPVCVIDDEVSISRFSRYAGLVRRCDLTRAADLVPYLLDTARRHGMQGWVLFPTRDDTVELLSRTRDQLSSVFRVPTPAWPTTSAALDKRLCYQLADSLGIAVPRTWYLSTREDVSSVDGEPPFVVKPAKKTEFVRATRAKAWRADTVDELRRLVDRAAQIIPVEQVMVQELIPGDGRQQLSYCALFKGNEALASMVACRLRQHPAEFGRATTYARTVQDPGVVAPAEKFLSTLGYYGLVEVEFKHDVRDGRTKLLDVNPRTWGYHTLGSAAGVDFPALLFRDLVGLPVAHVSAQPDVGWVRLVTDLPTGLAGLRRGTVRPRDYVRSVRAAAAEAVFAADDLMPAIAELALVPYLAVKRGY